MQAVLRRPVGYTPRSDCGLAGYERILARAGLTPVAGIDEAGRGACAGPLVVAAAVLKPARSAVIPGIPGLADSKALTAQARQEAYRQIMDAALDWSVVVIPPGDIDRLGLHVCNITGMRRALAGLRARPGFVLTDGFPVRGLAVPALAMWKGDQVAACVAAASVIAKVTRDRLMSGLHVDYPVYGFARHKGYSTPSHMTALAEHGPCAEHRYSFVNVSGLLRVPGEAIAGLADAPDGISPAAGQGGEPEDGHNGPIVDVIGEYAWSAASLASGARGA
ncbi:MAG TPA: ribonuclease HII [Streptosporangiaceae bacterium]|jgi:ribonuclease HII